MSTLKMALFAALILIVPIASGVDGQYQLIDGKYVKVSPLYNTYVGAMGKRSYPLIIEKHDPESGKAYRALGAFSDNVHFLAIDLEGRRLQHARSDAKELAKATLEKTGAAYAAVPIMTDRPKVFATKTEEIEAYHYSLGAAAISDSKLELLKPMLGSGIPEVKASSGVPREIPQKFFAEVIIAERGPDGNIVPRELTQGDLDRFMVERTRAIEQQARDRANKIERERLAAEEERRIQIEKAQADKEKAEKLGAEAAEHERMQRERERLASEEKAKEEKAKKSREAVEERMRERDNACRGGRTADCAYLDAKLTQDMEKLETFHHTAVCAKTDEAPKGACGRKGGCVYCAVSSQLAAAAEQKARTRLLLHRVSEEEELGKWVQQSSVLGKQLELVKSRAGGSQIPMRVPVK